MALFCGLRRGELRGLQWINVDFEAGVIRVERSWDPVKANRLRARCEALAAAARDEATRATLARVAGRLGSSVVRLLGSALGSQGDHLAAESPTSEGELPHSLHLLAVEARRTELAALMTGLPATIRSAPNGPYLLTNVQTLTDWLGVALDPAPQAALCRCGASSIKPWCDGSHSLIGFEDAKADGRIRDRLDRYTGLGVLIADNRGTCAHSGFCTDRAPTVFSGQR